MEKHMPTSVENSDNPEAVFSAGAFDITYFSDSPDGFEFETRKSIGRTEGMGPGPDLGMTEGERTRLSQGMKGEARFNGVSEVVDARQQLNEAIAAGADQGEIDRLRVNFGNIRYGYRQKGKKIGLRAIRLANDGNTLTADVKIVDFPKYNMFASPESSEEILEMSSAVGTAMVLRTSDDRLVIQHRAVEKPNLHEPGKRKGNASYADIPGVSVAGMMDASLTGEDRKPGTPDKVDTRSLKANILKEAGEELGLGSDDMKNVRIVGVARDNIKIHDEVLMLADTTLTSTELEEVSRGSNRNKNLGYADFEEKFFDIEASPEAVETLLTDVKCPLPPTHAAAMVAAGYSLVVQQQGAEAAHEWRQAIESRVRHNYQEIDQMVQEHYQQYPEVLDQVPERFWGKMMPERDLKGYAPAYTPEEQGLPTLEDELVRTGLMPETRQRVPEVYLFDVDGVITDPVEKRVTNEDILDDLVEKLESGIPVCFNTGRSAEWVYERVVSRMQERIEDPSVLENLIIVGEKGGSWVTFNGEGQPNHGAVETISVPDEMREAVTELVNDRYSDTMFMGEPKHTMLSIEMVDGGDISTFQKRREDLARELAPLVERFDTRRIFRIDETTIATDIESPNAGKALGADRLVEFLKYRGIKPDHFTAIGDSGSDVAMSDELARRGQSVEFVYVGNKPEDVNPRAEYQVSVVGDYSRGTAAYLASK